MNQHTTHPLVTAYLAELERLLAGIDPAERAEVLAGVREHLDGSLGGVDAGGQVSDEDVRAVLTELGPPQAVADEAYAGRPAHTPPSPRRVGALSRPWVPVVVAILTALALAFVVLVVSSTGGVVTTGSMDSSGNVVETTELSQSPLAGAFGAILWTLPLWVPIAVIVGLSPLWLSREKVALIGLVPGAAVVMGVLPSLGWWLVGANGVYAGAWIALALVVIGGGWLLVRLTRAASARAATT